MKILYINSSDSKGGAAQVCLNLAQGMTEKGHDVELWANKKSGDKQNVFEIKTHSHPNSYLSKLSHRLGVNNLNISSSFPKSKSTRTYTDFDVIHLHDIPQFNWKHLQKITHTTPTIWTQHTMAAFTGNCLYSYGCDRFEALCGSCPQFGKWPLDWQHRDGSQLSMRFKRHLTKNLNIEMLGVSHWITAQSQKGIFRKKRHHTISNAVDPKRFFPVEQKEARKFLGIPNDARVVLLSISGNSKDTRKGLDIALQALKKIKSDIFLLPLGISSNSEDLTQILNGVKGLPPRHIDNDEILRQYYSAADIIWHPSRADTSSMVSLEAFACGTPVIACSVGGVTETVKECAILIPPEDPDALIQATLNFFNDKSLKQNLHSQIQKRNTSALYETFINQHESLYKEVITTTL